jgi:hypothetical protein
LSSLLHPSNAFAAMIRSDYILRLIEELGVFLRALMGDRTRRFRPAEDLQAAVENSCQQGLGLSYSTIRAMAPEDLLALCKSGGKTSMERCYLAATLDGCDAEIARMRSDAAHARESAQRALYFYGALIADPTVPPEYDIQSKSKSSWNSSAHRKRSPLTSRQRPGWQRRRGCCGL